MHSGLHASSCEDMELSKMLLEGLPLLALYACCSSQGAAEQEGGLTIRRFLSSSSSDILRGDTGLTPLLL